MFSFNQFCCLQGLQRPLFKARPRLSKRTSFVDEARGEELSEVISFDHDRKEADQEAQAGALAIYMKRQAELLEKWVDQMMAASNDADFCQARKDVLSVASTGVPEEEDGDSGEEGQVKPALGEVPSPGSFPKRSDRDVVASLVYCGGDDCDPPRRAALGCVLCAFAHNSGSNLALVISNGGLHIILAALVFDNPSLFNAQEDALDFFERATDPGGTHSIYFKDTVTEFAASDSGFVVALVDALKAGRLKSLTILAYLGRADVAISKQIAALDCVGALLAVLERDDVEMIHITQALDILVGLVDSTTGPQMAVVLVRTMQDFPTQTAVQMKSICLLGACAPFLEPEDLHDIGCGSVVVGSMRLCERVPHVQKAGCRILRMLSDVEGWCPDSASALRICPVVVAAMQKFGRVPGLIEDALAVLTAMASAGPEARAIVVQAQAALQSKLSSQQ